MNIEYIYIYIEYIAGSWGSTGTLNTAGDLIRRILMAMWREHSLLNSAEQRRSKAPRTEDWHMNKTGLCVFACLDQPRP